MLIQREIGDVIVCRLAQDPHVTVFIVVEEEASVLLVFQEVTMPAAQRTAALRSILQGGIDHTGA